MCHGLITAPPLSLALQVRSPIAQALMYPFLPLFHQQKLDKLFEMAGLPVTPAVVRPAALASSRSRPRV